MRSAILFLFLTGCKDDCVEMCQRVENWLNTCGNTWEITFEDEGWTSIEDCYDEYADATAKDNKSCATDAREYDRRSRKADNKGCY